ncbi:hypothetical protein ISCGN_013118 [Ixodes scapularis]
MALPNLAGIRSNDGFPRGRAADQSHSSTREAIARDWLTVYRLCKAKMTFFKDLGIPGPKSHPIYGNLPELFEIGVLKATEGWASKYGDIVGYFDGFRPVMIVRDTQLLKQIFIRNFDSFNARLLLVELTSVKSVNNEKMSRLSGDKWRKMRALTSPAFKSSMLKRAFPIIEKCTDEFLEIMEEKVTPEQECVQIDQPFFRLSMEILLRYNVGARLNLQAASRETEPFVNSVRESLRRSPFKWIMIFNAIPLWYSIKRFSPENKPTIEPMAYIPFGIGPRSCPGSRLAETELPLIMAKTVAKFKLHLSDQPEKSTIKYVAPAILAFPDGGTWLKMEKI